MIRFYNGRVLSFTGGIKISRDEVWTDGGRIAYVGAERKDATRFEREIDLRGDLLFLLRGKLSQIHFIPQCTEGRNIKAGRKRRRPQRLLVRRLRYMRPHGAGRVE